MRDKYLCRVCGGVATEVHHIQELSPENLHDPMVSLHESNLLSLCNECHFKQHNNKREDINDEYEFDENGFPVRSHTPPVK